MNDKISKITGFPTKMFMIAFETNVYNEINIFSLNIIYTKTKQDTIKGYPPHSHENVTTIIIIKMHSPQTLCLHPSKLLLQTLMMEGTTSNVVTYPTNSYKLAMKATDFKGRLVQFKLPEAKAYFQFKFHDGNSFH
jgi:hypothetical protein